MMSVRARYASIWFCNVFVCVVVLCLVSLWLGFCGFFFQAEDGIRDLVRSRGLGDVYKRQGLAPRLNSCTSSFLF